MLDRAESLYESKRYAEAVRVYGEIHEVYPEWGYAAHALMMIGLCYNRMGNEEEALKAFEYAVQEYPHLKGFSEATYYYLGSAYIQAGRKEDALEAFEKCIALCKGSRDPNKFPYKDAIEQLEILRAGIRGAAGQEPALFADVQTEYFDSFRQAKRVPQSAPEIVSVSPPIGASGVDPATKEIRVTFDQDMGGGFSWTGGGPVFPKGTGRPQWVDKLTCVMPVALEPAKFYRVGINSKSHKNFSGVNGVPARVRVIYFATEGADESVLRALKTPAVVSMTPENGATDVPSTLTEMSVTFDQPMVGGFSWTGGGDQFPEGTGRPGWSADKMACSRPIKLKPNWSYRLGLNSPSHVNFQSANGVPLEPVVWRFSTGE